jgi:hypothetical protein
LFSYGIKAQNLAHTLAASNEALRETELVSYILAELGTEYDPLVTSITTRVEPIFLDELYCLLLTH